MKRHSHVLIVPVAPRDYRKHCVANDQPSSASTPSREPILSLMRTIVPRQAARSSSSSPSRILRSISNEIAEDSTTTSTTPPRIPVTQVCSLSSSGSRVCGHRRIPLLVDEAAGPCDRSRPRHRRWTWLAMGDCAIAEAARVGLDSPRWSCLPPSWISGRFATFFFPAIVMWI